MLTAPEAGPARRYCRRRRRTPWLEASVCTSYAAVEACDRGAAGVEAGRDVKGAPLQSTPEVHTSIHYAPRLLDRASRRPRPVHPTPRRRDCTSGKLKNASGERVRGTKPFDGGQRHQWDPRLDGGSTSLIAATKDCRTGARLTPPPLGPRRAGASGNWHLAASAPGGMWR